MKHNLLAIGVAVVASQIIGFVWYSPMLFFDSWSSGFHMTPELPFQAGFGPFWKALIASAIAALIMSWIVIRQDIQTGLRGAELGILLAIGFVGTSIWLHYSFARIPTRVVLIDSGYSVLSLLTMGYFLGSWRKVNAEEEEEEEVTQALPAA